MLQLLGRVEQTDGGEEEEKEEKGGKQAEERKGLPPASKPATYGGSRGSKTSLYSRQGS